VNTVCKIQLKAMLSVKRKKKRMKVKIVLKETMAIQMRIQHWLIKGWAFNNKFKKFSNRIVRKERNEVLISSI